MTDSTSAAATAFDPEAIYVILDSAGRAAAFYRLDVHGEGIPADAVAITSEQWQAWIEEPNQILVKGKLKPGPVPPPAVPEVISDRQFFQQLAIDGDVTQDEALAAVTTGTLPKKLTDAIAALPAAQQFPAKMLLCGATEFHRSDPMVPVLGQALGKDAAALDAIWTAAFAL